MKRKWYLLRWVLTVNLWRLRRESEKLVCFTVHRFVLNRWVRYVASDACRCMECGREWRV